MPPPSPPRTRQNIPPPSPINNNNSQHRSNNYDISKVGHTIIDSLCAFGLDIGTNGIEAKVKYRSLSRIYHPDVHDTEKTGLSHNKAQSFFQIINNAHSFLREKM